jgi:hypothetical protein
MKRGVVDAFNRSVVERRSIFLEDMLRRGSPFAEIAGFLQRSELEISEKAKELEVKRKRRRFSRTAAPSAEL